MRQAIELIKSVRCGALFESGKIVFSLIGLGTVLGDFMTMKLWLVGPMMIFFLGAWAGLYSQTE